MIDIFEVRDLISHMRKVGSDTQACEVKEAAQGLPKSIGETISAFSNMSGGLIMLGLSEKQNFALVPGFDSQRACSELQAAADSMTPVVRMKIEKIPFESGTVVVARVPPAPAFQRPCFITKRGKYDGSFIRSGDGNRRLSAYEVDRLAEARTQPTFDLEPVKTATFADLNPEIVKKIVRRVKDLFPRVFGQLEEETILIQLGMIVRIDGVVYPTMAGLLAAGRFPQQFFPRLEVVFTLYAGTSKAGGLQTGERYVHSQELVGSIPDMLTDVLTLVRQKMNVGALIEGGLRRDVSDYPLAAVREAVANALQHRDYSPEGRGTHVQVNMYADRLEITNPGGLYGIAAVESLGKEDMSSARNLYLSRLLAYTPCEDGFVVENKGAGFMVIESALAQASKPPAKVENSVSLFRLTLEKRHQAEAAPSVRPRNQLDEAMLEEIRSRGSMSVKDMMAMFGLSRPTIAKHIRNLVEGKLIEPLEPRRSPKQRYRLALD